MDDTSAQELLVALSSQVDMMQHTLNHLSDRQTHLDAEIDHLMQQVNIGEGRQTVAMEARLREERTQVQSDLGHVEQELRAELTEVAQRLTCVESDIGQIHQSVAKMGQLWPTSAVVFVSVASTLSIGIVIAWLRSLGF